MDLYTFGKTPATQSLVRILNEQNNAKQTTYVTRFLISQNNFAKEVVKIKNIKLRAAVINMWRREIKEKTFVNMSEIVASFVKNIVLTNIKIIQREIKKNMK